MGLENNVHQTGPISWITIDASDLVVGDIVLVDSFDVKDRYGIVTRCYDLASGNRMCHIDIGMDSIPKSYNPYECIIVGRCCAPQDKAEASD